MVATQDEVRRIRRRVVTDGLAISFSAAAFAIVYGLAARQAGFSFVEAMSMSAIVLAGAAQFAALGLVVQGVPWAGILVLVALLNARHLLYSASLAPWFAGTSRRARSAAAYVLADETYALAMPAIRSLGRLDLGTYAVAAAMPVVPWIIATAVGYLGGELLPDPRVLGMDVVFPAAMAGLAVALVTDSRSLAAAITGAILGLVTAIGIQPSVGVLVGGLGGPLIAMALPDRRWTGGTPSGAGA